MKKNAPIKSKKIGDILSYIYQIICITSRCVFFSISCLYRNNDDIVRGGGWKVMIGTIISENDDNCGPPLSYF